MENILKELSIKNKNFGACIGGDRWLDTMDHDLIDSINLINLSLFCNTSGLGGSELTSQAFGSVISWFPYILTIAILLFAFSLSSLLILLHFFIFFMFEYLIIFQLILSIFSVLHLHFLEY